MSGYHMTPAEFRKHGREVIDFIADYYESVEAYPVLSQVNYGEIREMLPDSAPEAGESFSEVLKDVDRVIMPGITHWQSPSFFGYFPCNASGPGILGELLSAGLNVQGMMWSTSPACTELEAHVLDWIADMLDLPRKFKSTGGGGGVILDTASSASLCALVAARERATGGQSNVTGADPSLVAYTSSEAHSSIEKALRIIGIGSDRVRSIETDEAFAMDVDDLESQILADRKAGLRPFVVSATVGTTASNGFDPIERIGQVCRAEGLWLHVDAAMSGTAAICPEFRHILNGLEWADSFCFNPHKWMFTNFDCDCFFVADRDQYAGALAVDPTYLQDRKDRSDTSFDYRNWQIPLGRRFRALKLWFVIRHYGIDGLRHHIREHIDLAQKFSEWICDDDLFELLAPHPLNLVCFGHKDGNDFTQRLLEKLNASGKLFVSHAVLKDRYAIRMSIGQTMTEERHVQKAYNLIRETALELASES